MAKLGQAGKPRIPRQVPAFRSLDDLLTAIPPIPRSAVRSPDPVWSSTGPLDLAAVAGTS